MTIAVRRRTRTLERGIEWRPRHDPHYLLASIMVSVREAPPICILQRTLLDVERHLRFGGGAWNWGLLTGQLCFCRRSHRPYVLLDGSVAYPPLDTEPDDYAAVAAAMDERIAELEHRGIVVAGYYRSGVRVVPRPSRGEVGLFRALFEQPWQTMLLRDLTGTHGTGAFLRIEPMDGQPYAAAFTELLPRQGWRQRRELPASAVAWTNYRSTEPVGEVRVSHAGDAPAVHGVRASREADHSGNGATPMIRALRAVTRWTHPARREVVPTVRPRALPARSEGVAGDRPFALPMTSHGTSAPPSAGSQAIAAPTAIPRSESAADDLAAAEAVDRPMDADGPTPSTAATAASAVLQLPRSDEHASTPESADPGRSDLTVEAPPVSEHATSPRVSESALESTVAVSPEASREELTTEDGASHVVGTPDASPERPLSSGTEPSSDVELTRQVSRAVAGAALGPASADATAAARRAGTEGRTSNAASSVAPTAADSRGRDGSQSADMVTETADGEDEEAVARRTVLTTLARWGVMLRDRSDGDGAPAYRTTTSHPSSNREIRGTDDGSAPSPPPGARGGDSSVETPRAQESTLDTAGALRARVHDGPGSDQCNSSTSDIALMADTASNLAAAPAHHADAARQLDEPEASGTVSATRSLHSAAMVPALLLPDEDAAVAAWRRRRGVAIVLIGVLALALLWVGMIAAP